MSDDIDSFIEQQKSKLARERFLLEDTKPRRSNQVLLFCQCWSFTLLVKSNCFLYSQLSLQKALITFSLLFSKK